ncbi:hypothetical protein [Thiocapsa sp.]|uniref:hypothetical protein n=1 Tax=Thiocapsa sp. TaxID=2024551 RepID=UPI002CD5C149|nr:hypothetical protein [Thiocapsa sp.]HSO81996.1 hypothetical protein [Thiocapsa sp.]
MFKAESDTVRSVMEPNTLIQPARQQAQKDRDVTTLDRAIHIGTAYTRSINLTRDADAPDLIRAYVPTSRAVQALERMADGLSGSAHQRALALSEPVHLNPTRRCTTKR